MVVKTPRGTDVHVTIDEIQGAEAKKPTLVIAPGQGYNKNLPLIQDLGAKAAQLGFLVYRFDWSYYSADPKHGQPSDDLSAEAEDMKAVIELANSNPSVDQGKIILAGKSIGTLVAYKLFRQNSFAGLILMTPICTDPDSGKAIGNESYPDFSKNTKPISLILGNADPLCKLPMLYDFTKDTNGNTTINVFAGGHSLTMGPFGDPAYAKINAQNLDAATTAASVWAEVIVGH